MTNKHFNSILLFISILFICIIFFHGSTAAQPNLEWVKTTVGESQNIGYSVAVDKDSNVYVAGLICGYVDFDPGPGVVPQLTESYANMFISKYNSTGNLVWVKSTKASGGISIALDDSCNLYMSGSFFGTVDLDPGPGVYNVSNSNYGNIYICKWDSSGDFVWANQLGIATNISSFRPGKLILDDYGNSYLTGIAGSLFVAKFDTAGIQSFLYNWPFYPSFTGYTMDLDYTGNIVITGRLDSYYRDFDLGPGVSILDPNDGRIFIMKLTASGDFIWSKNFGGLVETNTSFSLATDSINNIYVA